MPCLPRLAAKCRVTAVLPWTGPGSTTCPTGFVSYLRLARRCRRWRSPQLLPLGLRHLRHGLRHRLADGSLSGEQFAGTPSRSLLIWLA
jgi:hypothetical protein